MADVTIRGLTAQAMQAYRNAQIVSAAVRNNILYLKKADGSEFTAGTVGGIQGPPGDITVSPASGDLAGNYPSPTIRDRAITSVKVALAALNGSHMDPVILDGAANVKSLRSLGTGALQAAPGNHTHAIPLIRTGLVQHTASAVNTKTIVAYPNQWPEGYFGSGVIPTVILTPDSTVPENIPYWSVCSITSNGFSISATRTTATFTYYRYIAVGPTNTQ
jgi:hypothetical protein